MIVKKLLALLLIPHFTGFRSGKAGAIVGLVFLVVPAKQVSGQYMPVGARALGMASAYVALANTADGVFMNPGGLGQISGTEINLFYQKPFGLQDVKYGTLALTLPVAGFRASLGLMSLGNSLYSEQKITGVVSHHFLSRLFYGVGLSYWRTHIKTYGTDGSLTVDLGIILAISKRLQFGFMAQNVTRAKRGVETLPQTLNSGFALSVNPRLTLSLEVYKEVSNNVRFPEEIRFGVEVKPLPALALRAGTANHPNRFSAGFGLRFGHFGVDYAFFTHSDLGQTHQFSLSAGFGLKPKSK